MKDCSFWLIEPAAPFEDYMQSNKLNMSDQTGTVFKDFFETYASSFPSRDLQHAADLSQFMLTKRVCCF